MNNNQKKTRSPASAGYMPFTLSRDGAGRLRQVLDPKNGLGKPRRNPVHARRREVSQ